MPNSGSLVIAVNIVECSIARRDKQGPFTYHRVKGTHMLPPLLAARRASPSNFLKNFLRMPRSYANTLPSTVDGLVSWFQEAMTKAKEMNIPWQAVMDAFRPHTVAVWKSLSLEERHRFLTQYRPTWEICRHRAPRPQLEAVQRWEAEGWVKRTAATLRRAEKVGDSFRVELQERAGTRSVEVDQIVIATGPEADVQRLPSPLWQQMVAESVVEADPLRLGILTDERGAVMQRGAVAPGLWALGSLLRPQFFESTAVPDLSKRAVALSVCLLATPDRADYP